LVVCWLIVAGVNVDLVDKFGRTALFTACIEGHENVAELLLKYGADVNLSVFFFFLLALNKNSSMLCCSSAAQKCVNCVCKQETTMNVC